MNNLQKARSILAENLKDPKLAEIAARTMLIFCVSSGELDEWILEYRCPWCGEIHTDEKTIQEHLELEKKSKA